MQKQSLNILTIFLLTILGFTSLLSQQKGGEIINEEYKESGQTYALVVGISDYQDDEIPDLEYADRDAEAFAGFLQSRAGGSLDLDHLRVLLNEKATLGNVGAALTWLVEVAEKGDKVIIYFSGHGDVESTTHAQPGFLLCWDAPARVYFAGGALGLYYFQNYISTLSIQNEAKVTVIADACRSGKLSGSSVNGSQVTSANLLTRFANESKILSCQPSEYSIEGNQWGGGRGAFSYHLVNGLYGMADRNEDKQVTMSELRTYLEEKVTPEVAPYEQLPEIDGDGREVLAYVDEELLANLIESKRGQVQMYSAIALKGLKDKILDSVDHSIKQLFDSFEVSLEEQRFLAPETRCAEYYYQQLLEESSVEPLHSGLTRNYAAALQDNAQQELNVTLKSGLTADILAGKYATTLYQDFPKNLARAAELLGESHYLYNEIKARQFYFESILEEFNKDKREKLYHALKWQADMPHAYNSLIYTYPENLEDSALYAAEKTMQLVPAWVLPYIQLSRFYRYYKLDIEASYKWLQKGFEIDSTSALLWYEMGRDLRVDERYKEAEYWLKKVLESTGKEICFPCAHVLLSEVYTGLERYEEAEIQAFASLEADHKGFCIPCGYNGLASIYENMGRTEDRRKYILKALEHDSTFVAAYNDLARLKTEEGDFHSAEKLYLKAISLDSTRIYVLKNLASLYKTTKNFEASIPLYLKAIGLDSSYYSAYTGLSLAYNKTQQIDLAIRVAKMSIGIDSFKTAGWTNLGFFHNRLKQWEKGTEYLLQSIGLDSINSVAYYNLGLGSYSLENYDRARHAFEETIHLDSNYASAWLNLGGLLYSHYRETEKAINVSKKGFQLNPEKLSLAANVAGFNAMSGDLNVAEEYANIVLQQKPGDISTLNVMGIIYTKRNDYEKSIEYYKKILTIDSKNAKAYVSIGKSYIQLKKYNLAEENLHTALEISPKYVNALTSLGEIYRIRRQFEESYNYYRRAHEIRPDKKSVVANLVLNCQYRRLWDEAETYQLKQIENNPENVDYLEGYAYHFMVQDKWEQALPILQEVLDKDSSHLAGNLSMALTLLNLDGNQERAIQYYNSFIQYFDDKESSWVKKAQWAYATGENEKAWEYLEIALEKGYNRDYHYLLLEIHPYVRDMMEVEEWEDLEQKYFVELNEGMKK